MSSSRNFDTVIVGGGPAGLSAALHLAYHGREVLILDRGSGALFYTLTRLWNLPGFVGSRGVDIQRALEKDARAFGATIERASVVRASGTAGAFVVETLEGERIGARTLLLATGIARYHPLVDGDHVPWLAYAGKANTFYCTDCESPELLGKDVVVIGTGGPNAPASDARTLSEFARSVRVLLTAGRDMSPEWRERLRALDVPLIEGSIRSVDGRRGVVRALVLDDGRRVEADAYFVTDTKHPRADLARQLGCEIGPKGHVVTGWRGQTKVEGVWAAGDVQPQTQQVPVAMGSGNIAAVMIDQHLTRLGLRRLGAPPGAQFRAPGVRPATAPGDLPA